MTSLPAEKRHMPTTSSLAPDRFFWLENSAGPMAFLPARLPAEAAV